MTDLIDCIAYIKQRLAKLPDRGMTPASQDARRLAIETIARDIGRDLPKARIKDRWDGVSVSILGVRATCTGGIHGALTNWIAAAYRRLDQDGWVKTNGEKENVR